MAKRGQLTADVFARVLARLEAGDSVPVAAEAEGVTVGQVNGRLRKLGMTGLGRPQPRPMTAAELDRLLYPHDPPLTEAMLDYLRAFDAHLCDPDSVMKFIRWRRAARGLLGGNLDEPPLNARVMRRIAHPKEEPE